MSLASSIFCESSRPWRTRSVMLPATVFLVLVAHLVSCAGYPSSPPLNNIPTPPCDRKCGSEAGEVKYIKANNTAVPLSTSSQPFSPPKQQFESGGRSRTVTIETSHLSKGRKLNPKFGNFGKHSASSIKNDDFVPPVHTIRTTGSSDDVQLQLRQAIDRYNETDELPQTGADRQNSTSGGTDSTSASDGAAASARIAATNKLVLAAGIIGGLCTLVIVVMTGLRWCWDAKVTFFPFTWKSRRGVEADTIREVTATYESTTDIPRSRPSVRYGPHLQLFFNVGGRESAGLLRNMHGDERSITASHSGVGETRAYNEETNFTRWF